ncbi:protease B [Cystobacter fuscus]|uniref:Protease B n=1 Tax=Cystobacter fuscus TaxID=43 RepID=A0A250JCI6_9BACT|nr:LCCL domain-containing protein [Cystobacter fuscus]ATB41290.1 protease B [Cystobacter fuscus]
MFESSGGLYGLRLLAVVGALAVGGCGGAELEPAELTSAEPTGAARQELEACNYCPNSMSVYNGQIGTTIPCFCTDSKASGTGSLWGTDVYTSDSSPCRSAVHAGAITASGGFIGVTMLAGQTTYTGSTRNDVTSSSYYKASGYAGSFSVASADACALPCPIQLKDYRGQNSTVVSCNCTAAVIASPTGFRVVWGTDIYTDDSSVCHAAVHAGVITASGGIVNAVIAPAQLTYTGSTRNDITSNNYTNSEYIYGSYYFQ